MWCGSKGECGALDGGGEGFQKKLCCRLVFRIANWVNGVTFIYNADFSSF